MSELARPLLIYDGDCSFCRAWLARWQLTTRPYVDDAPSQSVAPRFPQIPAERFRQSVVLVEPDGHVSYGAEAVFRSYAHAPRGGLWLALYQKLPGFAPATELAYRLIARNRNLAEFVTRALWGRHVAPPGERITAWLFMRALALVQLVAFVSLAVQIVGLAGPHGILPIGDLLARVAQSRGIERFWLLPTLCWFNASAASLMAQCVLGIAAALALLFGLAPVLSCAVAYVLYLSLANSGGEFMWFQWDSLLLETTFLAMFVAPLRLRSSPRDDPPPTRFAVWMTRWLAFRLLFSSAVVKLSSGDPNWRNFTALRYHFETQPLPHWVSWYAHHLSEQTLRGSTFGTLAVEGLVPFLFIAPRRLRMAAAAIEIAFQLLIRATGNYGFFNQLTIVICLMLLDDGLWPAWLHRRFAPRAPLEPDDARLAPGRWPPALQRTALAALFVLSLVPFGRTFREPIPLITPLEPIYALVAPLQLIGPYGLFAVMTTQRLEIVLEGSDDGVTWKEYEFRWKPGDVMRRPGVTGPHMPRLDWQMWFAALDTAHLQPWYFEFCDRVLEGSRPVLALLGHDPFPAHPPRFLRSLVYDYHFTDQATWRVTGAWWTRRLRGTYGPAITLRDGQLVPVDLPAPLIDAAP